MLYLPAIPYLVRLRFLHNFREVNLKTAKTNKTHLRILRITNLSEIQITPWINGPIADALQHILGWTRRFAASAVVYSGMLLRALIHSSSSASNTCTACALALVVSIFIIESRVKKRLRQSGHEKPSKTGRQSFRNLVTHGISLLRLRISQMNIAGCILLAGVVSCLLTPWGAVPIVDRDKNNPWGSRSMIIVISVGLCCAPLLYLAEKRSNYPMFLPEVRPMEIFRLGISLHSSLYNANRCSCSKIGASEPPWQWDSCIIWHTMSNIHTSTSSSWSDTMHRKRKLRGCWACMLSRLHYSGFLWAS